MKGKQMKGHGRASLVLAGALIFLGSTWNCTAQVSSPEAVFVQGGKFEMGVAGGKDNPMHQVEVSSYYIAPYEVSVAQWREFTREVKTDFNWNADYTGGAAGPMEWRENDPVQWVTWFEALEYCNWLSRKFELKPAYSIEGVQGWQTINGKRVFVRKKVTWDRKANGFRLPTEVEWEYAARGGQNSNGTVYAGSSIVDEVGWYRENSGDHVHAIGLKKPNELKLYDMSGNVGEWCWDYYGFNFYGTAQVKNPIGPAFSTLENPKLTTEERRAYIRVVRGGSSGAKAQTTAVFSRGGAFDLDRLWIGIRVVRNGESE